MNLATVADIADAVNEEITDQGDIAMVNSILRVVSAHVRHYGQEWPDPILAPEIAVAITIQATTRGYLNPEGFKLERGDEITFDRSDIFAAGATLTAAEIKACRQAAGKSGWYSVLMQRDVTVTATTVAAEDDSV
jgi:hypothetical protein